MRVVFILFLIHIILCVSLNAQELNLKETGNEGIRKNTLYFEILGNGVIYSINYDRIIPLKNNILMFLRIGGNEYHGAFTDKLSFNYIGATGILFGGEKHFFETGIAYTHFSGSRDRLFSLMGGYRFQGKKGLSFRATPMYIINSEKGDTFGNCLWFGISFGYSF